MTEEKDHRSTDTLVNEIAMQSEIREPDHKWYNSIRKEILLQSDLKEDSIADVYNMVEGKQYLTQEYYKSGQLLKKKYYNSKGSPGGFTYFSHDRKFELRSEIWPNGTMAFEGIVWNENFYGLSRWWYSNGIIREIGVRFKNDKVGIWKKYDEKNNLLREKDYGNSHLYDSLPGI